jgi:hypothetical protein
MNCSDELAFVNANTQMTRRFCRPSAQEPTDFNERQKWYQSCGHYRERMQEPLEQHQQQQLGIKQEPMDHEESEQQQQYQLQQNQQQQQPENQQPQSQPHQSTMSPHPLIEL